MVILHFLMFVFVLVVPGFVQIFTNTIWWYKRKRCCHRAWCTLW